MPRELVLLNNLDRYGGAQNVLGRPLGVGEIRRMNYVQNLIRWHQERAQAENWATWAQAHPAENRALIEAMQEAEVG